MKRQSDRLHYLDAVRAFVMSIGVILHAGLIDRFWLSRLFSDVSGLFRMKLFFLIAGFFAALLVTRRGLAHTQNERIVRFGVPFAVGVLLLLNPIANLLYYQIHVGPIAAWDFFTYPLAWNRSGFAWDDEAPIFMTWHNHLWFLAVAILYCIALKPFLLVADSRIVQQLLAWLVAPERGRALPMVLLSFGSAIIFLAMRAAHLLTTQQFLWGSPVNFLAQNVWLYAPYFLLGILAYKSEALFEKLHDVRWGQIVVAAIILALCNYAYDIAKARFGMAAAETLEYFSEGLMGFWACVIMFAAFRRFVSGHNPVVRYLSDAAYTVYVFHIVVIATCQFLIAAAGLGPRANYFLSILLAYPACLLIHRYFVDRGPLRQFFFNGKRPVRPPVSAHG